jgi:FixJ family two-component response regulator
VSAIEGCVAGFEDGRPARSENLPNTWVGIVDDDASLRAALARALRFNGIRVETFGSAEEFLDRDVGGEPDCIVLDIHLGGLSGFDLQARLMAEGGAPPIIFITAHDDTLAERARSNGACGYLRKPFETKALVALVRPHLHSSE